MEGHAIGHQAQLTGQHQQIHGHIALAAELARQRPVGSGRAFGQNAHVHLGTRRGLGDIAQVGFGVGGEQTHALLVEGADVLGLLDGVAVADLLRLDAQRQHLVQLVDGGDVEVRALVLQQAEHFIGRIGFYRVIHLGVGKACNQIIIGTVYGFQVHDQEGGFMLISTGTDAAEGLVVKIFVELDIHGVGSKA